MASLGMLTDTLAVSDMLGSSLKDGGAVQSRGPEIVEPLPSIKPRGAANAVTDAWPGSNSMSITEWPGILSRIGLPDTKCVGIAST